MAFNSTIISKKKKCKSCGRMDYIFSKGNCKQCATVKSTANRAEKLEYDDTEESRSNIISDLDAVFSDLIRIKASGSNGQSKCFICGKESHYKQLCNNHYIQRSVIALRWEENNCKSGCYECNNRHEVDTEPFTIKMEEWRKGITAELTQQSREVVKVSTQDLKELLISLRQQLKMAKIKLTNSK